MAFVGTHFVAKNPQRMLLSKTLGEAFGSVSKALFGADKREMARAWGIDQRTVENVRRGNAGAAMITKALLARKASHDDAWDMADAILEQVLGESRSEYEERKLREHIEKTNNAISLHQERKARRSALAERAAFLVNSMAGGDADDDRAEVG